MANTGVPAFTLVGFRHRETGILRSVGGEYDKWRDACPDGWEPVFTGGPDVIQPVLDAAVKLANDPTDGTERRASRWVDHRWNMQRALTVFMERGGCIP